MLINVAQAGYGRAPDFEVHPPGEPPMEQRIAWALLTKPVFRNACEQEGVDISVARRIAGLIKGEDAELDSVSGKEDWTRRRLVKL